MIATSVDLKKLKSDYLELITSGYTESVALKTLDFPRSLYIKLITEDRDFVKNVDEARKVRADFWVSKIAETVDHDFSKDEIGSERLKFDKLQFLAKADNPDKYGNNTKKVDINIDLKQFKLLPPDEAVKALAQDPFALGSDEIAAETSKEVLEAEFVEIPKDDDLL